MTTEELRVGDAERDEVAAALHEHFAQGRLTRDELDERLTTALSAKTVGDLRRVTRDLPGAAPAAPAPWHWDRGRVPWEPYGARWGRGPVPWAHGPHRGRPFFPLLVVALVAAAVTGWWPVLPLLGVLWFAAAFTGLRYARRRHAALTGRR